MLKESERDSSSRLYSRYGSLKNSSMSMSAMSLDLQTSLITLTLSLLKTSINTLVTLLVTPERSEKSGGMGIKSAKDDRFETGERLTLFIMNSPKMLKVF